MKKKPTADRVKPEQMTLKLKIVLVYNIKTDFKGIFCNGLQKYFIFPQILEREENLDGKKKSAVV